MNFGNKTVATDQMLNNGSWNFSESATNNTFMEDNSTAALNQTFNFNDEDSNDYLINVLLALSQAVEAILFLVSCWMLASFVSYCIQNEKWKRRQTTSFFNGRLLHILYTIILVFVIQKFLITQVYIQAPRGSNSSFLCNVVDTVGKLYFSIITYLIYCFLWVRQKVVYNENVATGKCINFLSWGIFAMLSSHLIILINVFIIFDRQEPISQGCVTIKSKIIYLYPIMYLLMFLAQFGLLGLFVYPVMKNTMEYKSRNHGSKWITLLCNAGTLQPGEIQKTIRRLLTWTCVAVFTDIIFIVLNSLLIPEHFPSSIRSATADIMLFVNVICIFMTFKDRWKILRIFFPRKQNKVTDIPTKLTSLPQT